MPKPLGFIGVPASAGRRHGDASGATVELFVEVLVEALSGAPVLSPR